MIELIPRDAAIGAIERWWMCSQTTWQSPMTILRAIPAIDPAAIREAAIREALEILCEEGWLGSSYTRILALIGEKK